MRARCCCSRRSSSSRSLHLQGSKGGHAYRIAMDELVTRASSRPYP
jgi:hypothetical protein